MNENFKEVLKDHAKSFYFAGLLLDKNTLNDASVLYAFCRQLDDAADEGTDNVTKLNSLITDYKKSSSENQVNNAFKKLQDKYELDQIFINDLMDGIKADLSFEQPNNLKDLIMYSYQVAGTVGGLMAKILGANDQNAWKFAIDLGIGMQLTNIARDIKEDAINKRIYIPKDMLGDVTHQNILDDSNKDQVFKATESILKIADQYDESGLKGIFHIPHKNKFSILVAAHLYRSIGNKVLKNKSEFLKMRSYLNIFEKFILLSKLYFQKSKLLSLTFVEHDTDKLHSPYLKIK